MCMVCSHLSRIATGGNAMTFQTIQTIQSNNRYPYSLLRDTRSPKKADLKTNRPRQPACATASTHPAPDLHLDTLPTFAWTQKVAVSAKKRRVDVYLVPHRHALSIGN